MDGAKAPQTLRAGTAKRIESSSNTRARRQAEDYENDFPDVWKEWRGDGTGILVIASQTDDGDDLNPSIIPRCAK